MSSRSLGINFGLIRKIADMTGERLVYVKIHQYISDM